MISFSVITACFNSAQTIGDALSSVVVQSYPKVEQVIIDGGSHDGTMDVVSRLGGRVARIVSEPDNGIYDALNKGICRSNGDIVGFLHSDDFYADSEVLSRIAQAFEDPSVHAVYSDLQYVLKADTSRVLRYWRAGEFSKRSLYRGWMPPHPTLYVRREWYDRIGGFDVNYRISADYDFILRLFMAHGFKSAYLPGVTVKMRVGGNSNRSLSKIFCKSREDLTVLRRNGVGGIGSLLCKNIRKVGQFLG